MDTKAFYLRVAEALSGCQLVEQELRLYITEAFELVRKCVGSALPFKMTGEDYAGESHGRLVRTFEKLTDNTQLVADLREFAKARNTLAHRGVVQCLDPDDELDHTAAADFQHQLAHVQREAERLRLAIHEQANNFRGHLWFDAIDNAQDDSSANDP